MNIISIVDKVHEVSEKQGANFRKDADFLKIEKFYKSAIESGIVKKPEYNLPQIDTIGIIFSANKRQE